MKSTAAFRRRALAAACVMLSSAPFSGARAAVVDRSTLVEIPVPDTGRLEEAAQKQLAEARVRLEETLADSGASASELAEAYGFLGQLYYVYEFEDLAKTSFENARSLAPGDYRWHYYLAVLARLEADWRQARSSLETVLEMQPGDLPALIRLGEAELELGDLDAAASTYEAVVSAAPDLAAGYAGRGRVAYLRGDYDTAIADFGRALELQPEATSLHHRRGMAYRQAGDLEAAKDELSRNTGGYLRYPDPLLSDLGSLLKSSQIHFNSGIAEVRKGNFDEAIRLFRLALEDQPDDALAAYNLGLALLKKGEREEGIEWLERSVDLDPGFRNGHYNLAILLADDERWPEVVEHLQAVHRIDPEDRTAQLELATALTKLGRKEEAVAELQALLDTHPRDPEALLNLGILQAGQDRPEEAIATFRHLLEIGGDPELQSSAHTQLGMLMESRGAAAAALAEFEAAVELTPDSVEAQANLAAALGRAGQFVEAAEHYAQVVNLAPDRIDGHFGRAMALILSEDYMAARQALEESLLRHPQNVAVAHALARLLATSPDPGVRDGPRALGMARAVFDAESTLEHAETLAMAQAEVGRFEDAVALQQQVVDEAEKRGETAAASRARRRLEGYLRDEPCRAPWGEE